MSDFNYRRRQTNEVRAGSVGIGGDNPIRIQSMTNTSTMDTDGSLAQIRRMADAGAELARLTAQGVREANNIGKIRAELRESGSELPLVADIHFNPNAAYASIGNADKIRINPGNFLDPGRTFRKLEYTDEDYRAELERLEKSVAPFLKACAEAGTAIRIGVNHGSLSDRIMSRYGDTPAGMVESAMEFLRICERNDFKNVVVSIKASNVTVMVETVRLLVEVMKSEGMAFPLHLGVTEAGDAEDGRIKSAVGIGTLLLEGIGDTIRVSLSESPEAELPVARMLVEYVASVADSEPIEDDNLLKIGEKRTSRQIGILGGKNVPVVVGERVGTASSELQPDFESNEIAGWKHIEVPFRGGEDVEALAEDEPIVLYTRHKNFRGAMLSAFNALESAGKSNPVIIKANYSGIGEEETIVKASVELGSILLSGFGDGIAIESDALSQEQTNALSFKILQSTRLRISATEYIACPGCGRTLFDLSTTLQEIKKSTSHLKGLKIGVMGCIVNGPGEMADADYGYVGAGKGMVSLYRGKECVEKNIPTELAVEKLLALIEKDKERYDENAGA